MSDQFIPTQDPTVPADDQSSQDNANLQHLRDKAASADATAQENARLKRDLAMAKAGVDPETPVGKLVLAALEGNPELDVSELVSAIAPASTEPPVVPDDEKNLTAARQDLATGADNDTTLVTPKKGAYDEASEQYERSRAASTTHENSLADAIAVIRKRGEEGDASVAFDPSDPAKRWREVRAA